MPMAKRWEFDEAPEIINGFLDDGANEEEADAIMT